MTHDFDPSIEDRSEHPVHWNTGRMYGAQGQRISAVQIGETVFFKDHDRMIIGRYDAAMPKDRPQLRDRVMRAYDENKYAMAITVPECIQDYPRT